MSNVQILINHLKSVRDLGFNMNYFNSETVYPEVRATIVDHTGHNCGTTACLAGHIHHLRPNLPGHDRWDAAGEWLGLETDDAWDLFFGNIPDQFEDKVPLSEITLEQAITVLEHLRDTGEVRWDLIVTDH